jgi:hypothetical protein
MWSSHCFAAADGVVLTLNRVNIVVDDGFERSLLKKVIQTAAVVVAGL